MNNAGNQIKVARSGCGSIKLRRCNSCKLVKYCGVVCQKNDWQEHKRICKMIRDKSLFEQPGSRHAGDCPICLLPLSTDVMKSTIMVCCSKVICDGCSWANNVRRRKRDWKANVLSVGNQRQMIMKKTTRIT